MIQIHDNFLDVDICNHLINFYKKNKDQSVEFGGKNSKEWMIAFAMARKSKEFKLLQSKLNEKSTYINNSIAETVQIVKWPVGSKQDPHYDIAYNHTTLTSVVYLNNNFGGGETYFTDGVKITPKIGRALFFDGQYYEHGVNDVQTHERYVVATWYKNKTIKVY